MELNLNLEGSVSYRENGKTVGFEQVPSQFLINFGIDSEGELQVSSVAKEFQVIVYDYNEATDEETPVPKTFTIKKTMIKGYILKSLVPERFEYNQETETLILHYLYP